MLRQAALVLLMAAVLAPAGTAARYSHAAAPSTPRPAERVVVRTQLVPASSDGFHWLDAAAGFGAALVSVSAGLLVIGVASRRSRGRPELTKAQNS
jgi:hypothetical protein